MAVYLHSVYKPVSVSLVSRLLYRIANQLLTGNALSRLLTQNVILNALHHIKTFKERKTLKTLRHFRPGKKRYTVVFAFGLPKAHRLMAN